MKEYATSGIQSATLLQQQVWFESKCAVVDIH